MSNYTKGQIFANLADSDADPTVFDTEFSSVATASATKADKTGSTFTGAISLPAGASGAQAVQAQEIYKYAFPSGTSMSFFQATAPTGWTQDVTNNDAMLRVVSTAGGGTNGASGVAGGVVFPTVTDSHAITVSEMPSHTHTYTSKVTSGLISGGSYSGASGFRTNAGATGTSGGGAGHTHTLSTPNWIPKYLDVIVCTKD